MSTSNGAKARPGRRARSGNARLLAHPPWRPLTGSSREGLDLAALAGGARGGLAGFRAKFVSKPFLEGQHRLVEFTGMGVGEIPLAELRGRAAERRDQPASTEIVPDHELRYDQNAEPVQCRLNPQDETIELQSLREV